MQDLYEKTQQNETVGKIIKILKKTKKTGRYFDLKKLREEAKKAGLYQMKFPKLPNSETASWFRNETDCKSNRLILSRKSIELNLDQLLYIVSAQDLRNEITFQVKKFFVLIFDF